MSLPLGLRARSEFTRPQGAELAPGLHRDCPCSQVPALPAAPAQWASVRCPRSHRPLSGLLWIKTAVRAQIGGGYPAQKAIESSLEQTT